VTTPTTTTVQQSDAQAIIDTVKRQMTPTVVVVEDRDGEARQLLVHPSGRVDSVKALTEEYAKTPERRTGCSIIHDQESLIDIVLRFKDDGSALFADLANRKSPSLQAIFDYHEQMLLENSTPRFCKHRASYRFPLSDEWTAWTGIDGKAMSQAEFAEWIELRALDLVDPTVVGPGALEAVRALNTPAASPARIQEISRGLAIRVDEQIRTAVTLQTGETQLVYQTTHNDASSGAPITVPALFAVAIPVFKDGVSYVIPVRLRYRVTSGQIKWTMHLVQAERAFDRATREVCANVAEKTGLPLFYGCPET